MNTITSFDNKYSFLSNFYEVPVEYNGITYQNSEAAFQHAKCKNLTTAEQIKFLNSLKPGLKREVMVYVSNSDANPLTTVFSLVNPSIAKKLGRVVPMKDTWENVKYETMEEIVRNKFTQNSTLKAELLETGDSQLLEGNYWHDNTWGKCVCYKCVGKVGSNGKNNNLGAILMKIREELRG